MIKQRPCALSIAGFDPSGGAGLAADLKAFEAHRTQGLAACTAITYQHESAFDSLDWLPLPQIMKQLEVLFRQYSVAVAKIGLIQSMDVLEELIYFLHQHKPTIKIIWDPILKASAGFTFHEQVDRAQLEKACRQLYLITPNWLEMEQLMPGMGAPEGAAVLSQYCHILLKGGHNESRNGYDYLYSNGQVQAFRPKQQVVYPKHGSGCVLSAAITALLANEYKLPKACLLAKKYTGNFLASNTSLLGYHKI